MRGCWWDWGRGPAFEVAELVVGAAAAIRSPAEGGFDGDRCAGGGVVDAVGTDGVDERAIAAVGEGVLAQEIMDGCAGWAEGIGGDFFQVGWDEIRETCGPLVVVIGAIELGGERGGEEVVGHALAHVGLEETDGRGKHS